MLIDINGSSVKLEQSVNLDLPTSARCGLCRRHFRFGAVYFAFTISNEPIDPPKKAAHVFHETCILRIGIWLIKSTDLTVWAEEGE